MGERHRRARHGGLTGESPVPHTAEVTIETVGAQGDGIARLADERVYVPLALPGERVRVALDRRHRDGIDATPLEWLVRSERRGEAPCAHFGDCGGCAAQHLRDDDYVAWKVGLLTAALDRAAVVYPRPAPLARTPPRARRRASFAARRGGGGVVIGFNARGSERVIDLAACPVLRPDLAALLAPLRGLLAATLPPGGALDVEATASDAGIDLLLTGTSAPDRALRERLAVFAADRDLTRIAWRATSYAEAETIAARRKVQLRFGGVAVEPPPGAFLQASEEGERAIIAAVSAAAADAKRIADLYAGCGTLTFPLADRARVHAVEGDAAMAAAVQRAKDKAGLAGRVTVERRDLARRPLLAAELATFDAVVFDPPRAGAKAQAAEIARSRVPLVVAVSCNPASFARDARLLADGGYRLRALTPIDQFLWSPHLEVVGAFGR